MIGIFHTKSGALDIDGYQSQILSGGGSRKLFFVGELYDKNAECVLRSVLGSEDAHRILATLSGQFLIVIFDDSQKRLKVFRDQFGQVPVYYAQEGDFLLFSDSIRAISNRLAHGTQLDRTKVGEYLVFRWLAADQTFFGGVKRLIAGNYLSISTSECLRVEPFYHFLYRPQKTGVDSGESFEKFFLESLSRQLEARDPRTLGVLSSGGLDSGILVACAAKLLGKGLRTFLVACDEYENNRIEDVQLISETFGTRHATVFVDGRRYADSLPRTILLNEDPLNHPSSVLRFCLYSDIRGEVDHVLSGEGADCLYCGYYIFSLLGGLCGKCVESPLVRRLARMVPSLPEHPSLLRYVEKIMTLLRTDTREFVTFHDVLGANIPAEVVKMLDRSVFAPIGTRLLEFMNKYDRSNQLDGILELYQTWYLHEALETIYKLAIETNVWHQHTFIDRCLVEYFNGLPWRKRNKFGTRKYQVRLLAQKYLPKPYVVQRKEGFGVPLRKWFQDKQGLGRYIEVLRDTQFRNRNIFDGIFMRNMLAKWDRGELSSDECERLLWPVINVELWCRLFLDGGAGIP